MNVAIAAAPFADFQSAFEPEPLRGLLRLSQGFPIPERSLPDTFLGEEQLTREAKVDINGKPLVLEVIEQI